METEVNRRLKAVSKLKTFGISIILFNILVCMLYLSGWVHLFPHSFAVDSQERMYLLFSEGGYCAADNRVVKILPPFNKANVISISDENLLSYARSNEVTVYDIDQSDPAAGKLTEVDRFILDDEDAFFASRRLNRGDEQNGATYTYERGFFSYRIMRIKDGETSSFYHMPMTDVIWRLITISYIPVMVVVILRYALHFARALLKEQNKYA